MTPDPNLPRGVQAFLFEGAERRRRAEEAAVSALRSAGLSEVLLPVLDFAAPYDGVTADEEAQPYRFVDRQGELLSLRSDFTPMAARVLAPRLAGLPLPVELFYRGDVVRDEEVGVGRSREFSQVGAERYGDASFASDERMLGLLLACVAVPAPRLLLTLGFAGLLDALLAAVAPALTARDGARLANVVALCRERRVTAVEAALAKAGARPADAMTVARSLLVGFDPDSPLFAAPVLSEGAAALRRARDLARATAPGAAVVIDLAGTPTAPYYTGLTYGLDCAGVAAPLAAGGRYDRLLARFGVPAPAVGFSIGIEALSSALDGNGIEEAAVPRPLRIAVGKGRLLPLALETLRRAGLDLPDPDGRRLVVPSASGDVEILLLKDDDVPTYVAHGGADLGVVGSDRVAESGEKVFTPVELPFGECRVALIGRAGEPFRPNGHPVTVGTKYRRVARRFFDERRIAHEVVPLSGSVELAAALGLTDVVVDLIETGGTIAANGLAEIETILSSRAVLIAGRAALSSRRVDVASLVERVARTTEVAC